MMQPDDPGAPAPLPALPKLDLYLVAAAGALGGLILVFFALLVVAVYGCVMGGAP